MAKPKRTFSANIGQQSVGVAGPDQIEYDLDNLFAALDPGDLFKDGSPGGINAENMKPGAVTDAVLGNRTVNQAITDPESDTGTLTQLLSWVVKHLKAVKGNVVNWYDAAASTISDIWAKFDAAVGHRHTGAGTDAPQIGTAGIADGAVTTSKIADGNITAVKIADANITMAKIADGAVTTPKIPDLNITTAKLADLSVTTVKIADGNVTTPKIADGNITTAKIADGAVTASKIAAGNVGTSQLADGAVTAAKLDPALVTQVGINEHRLASPIDHPDGAVATSKIADGAVTTSKVADGSITDAKLSDASTEIKQRFASHLNAADPHPQYTLDTAFDAHLADIAPHSGYVAQLGANNQVVNLFKALNQRVDTRSLILTYDANGRLTTVTEKDGATTVKTTGLGYDANNNLTTVTEQVAGKTITTTLIYTNGNLTSVTRSVA